MGGAKLVLVIAAGVFIGLLALLLFVFSGGGTTAWDFATTKDAMNDQIQASADLTANDGRSALELSCEPGQPIRLVFQAAQRTGGYLDDENYVERMVRYRVDEGPVLETVGVLGDNFIGFGERGERKTWDAPIIKALSGAETLAIETNTVRNGPIQLVFDVSGAEDMIQQLNESCGLT